MIGAAARLIGFGAVQTMVDRQEMSDAGNSLAHSTSMPVPCLRFKRGTGRRGPIPHQRVGFRSRWTWLSIGRMAKR